jgi:WD40 repeat protein
MVIAYNSLKVLKNGDLASTYNNYFRDTFTIEIRDPLNFELKANYSGHLSDVTDLVELPNGDLASASYDQTIKTWDRATGNLKNTYSFHTTSIMALAVLENGLLASGSYGTIVISKY